MFRHIARPLATTAPRSIIAPAPAPAPRSFSALAPKMAEGDTGAPKQGGAAQGGRANKNSDAFTKREAAQENFYIHEKEMEKLHALKKKLSEQRNHLDELEKHVDQLTKSKGQQ